MIADTYPLGPDAIERFDVNGFIRLKNVLDEQTIDRYEPEITAK